MIDPLLKEKIIGKCFAISSWAAKRGRASLDQDEKGFKRADKILDELIDQLTILISDLFLVKDDPIKLIETKEEDVWNE